MLPNPKPRSYYSFGANLCVLSEVEGSLIKISPLQACLAQAGEMTVLGFGGFFANDFVGHVARDFLGVVKFHRVTGPALSHAAQGSSVTEHFSQRHHGVNHLASAAIVHFFDP